MFDSFQRSYNNHFVQAEEPPLPRNNNWEGIFESYTKFAYDDSIKIFPLDIQSSDIF